MKKGSKWLTQLSSCSSTNKGRQIVKRREDQIHKRQNDEQEMSCVLIYQHPLLRLVDYKEITKSRRLKLISKKFLIF